MGALFRDVRDAVRRWAGTPALTTAAILSLALGIGANTAIFSLLDSLLLRRLPVDHADRLVRIHNPRFNNHSLPTWEQWRDGPPLFESVAAVSLMRPDVSPTSERQSAQGLAVSGSFFETLGVRPAAGRLIGPPDDRRGGSAPVAVLEYHYWQSAYGGRADAVGSTIPLDGQRFTIVGVTEPRFFGPSVGRRFDVAVSFEGYRLLYPDSARVQGTFVTIIGRLGPNQSVAEAEAALRARQPQIRAALGVPDTMAQLAQPWSLVSIAMGMPTPAQQRYAAPLRVLMALVVIVLIVACANVANLLLARTSDRLGDIAMRLSLGASRAQVLRSLLVDSLVLAAAGAAVAVVTGTWAARLLVNAIAVDQSGSLATWIDVPLDPRILAFTLAIGVASAVAFGVGPALRAMRVDPIDTLRRRSRTQAPGGRFGIAQGLAAFQVALALTLLFGGGLLVRSFVIMTTQDLGFDEQRVTVAVPDFNRSRVQRRKRVETSERVRAWLAARPGVDAVALAESAPFGLGTGVVPLTVPGRTRDDSTVVLNRISNGFFSTMNIALRAGRDFEPFGREAPHSAIVNEAFVAAYARGRDPIGQIFSIGLRDRGTAEIVGVAANARTASLREPVAPVLYLPFVAQDEPWIEINIRSTLNDRDLRTLVLDGFAAMAPGAGVEFRTVAGGIGLAAARDRALAWLAAAFGALALLLSAVGLFGVIANQVTRRRQELGVRLAVGAAPADVTTLVLRQTMVIVMLGVAAGIAGAAAAGRLIESLLFQLTPTNPGVLALSIAVLVAVTLFAGWLPARRAARLDPMQALRDE